jgi:hypothetical protein
MNSRLETRDVVRAMTLTALQLGKALGDRRLDYSEVVQLFGLIGIWKDAVKGIHRVPEELTDIGAADIVRLGAETVQAAAAYGVKVDSGKTLDLTGGAIDMSVGLRKVLQATGKL